MSIEHKNLELLDKSFEELEKLRKEVIKLEKIRQTIEDLKTGNENLPFVFGEAFEKVLKQADEYKETLGIASKTYLDGSNSLFTIKLNDFAEKNIKLENEVSRLVNTDLSKSFNDLQELFIEKTREDIASELDKIDRKTIDFQTKINNLQKEVNRLTNTDLSKSFNDLQKIFIEQTKKDVGIELKKIGEKTNDFQTKITSFGGEINRLEKVDLEKLFDKLQKTLSDIFGAINAINLTLTGLTTSLNSVIQSLGQIQKTVEDNFKETNKIITTFSTETNSHLNQQDKKNDIEFETLKNKVVNLSEQNIALKKEITTNRVIQIVGLVITISLLIYLIIKH